MGTHLLGVPHEPDSARSDFHNLAAQRTPRDGFINQILQVSKLGLEAVKGTTGEVGRSPRGTDRVSLG